MLPGTAVFGAPFLFRSEHGCLCNGSQWKSRDVDRKYATAQLAFEHVGSMPMAKIEAHRKEKQQVRRKLPLGSPSPGKCVCDICRPHDVRDRRPALLPACIDQGQLGWYS